MSLLSQMPVESYLSSKTCLHLPHPLSWPNHLNDVEPFLWNVYFLSSLWSKEKIKRGSTETLPLSHFSYFQTLSALGVFFSTQILWALKKKNLGNHEESQTWTFSLWFLSFWTDFLKATNLCLFSPFLGVINTKVLERNSRKNNLSAVKLAKTCIQL